MRGATLDHRILIAASIAVFVNAFMQSLETNDFWNQGVGIYFWVAMALPFALCWTKPAQVAENEEQQLAATPAETAEESLPASEQEPVSIL